MMITAMASFSFILGGFREGLVYMFPIGRPGIELSRAEAGFGLGEVVGGGYEMGGTRSLWCQLVVEGGLCRDNTALQC